MYYIQYMAFLYVSIEINDGVGLIQNWKDEKLMVRVQPTDPLI